MTDSASLGLAYTLAVGTVLFVALLILFEVLRRWIPDLYYWRNKATAYPEYADANGLPLGTAPKPGLFWPATVLPYSSSKLLESHGPDTVVFLRFLATQFQIFAVLSIFTMIVLVPTYATASNKNLDVKHPDHTVGVQILSLANVPVKDNRLWVTFFADFIILLVICAFQYRDICFYAALRRRYRASRNPANYAILVYDTPHDCRDESKIRNLFERLFPGEIASVHCARKAQALLKLKNKHLNAFTNREAAQFDMDVMSKETTIRSGLRKVPAIDYWSNEQQRLADEAIKADQDLDQVAPLTHAAIVVFKSKRTATMAAMTNVWHNTTDYKVRRAPEPDAINWDRMHITNRTARIRYYAAIAILLAIAIFWFAPVLVIQSLSNFQELAKLDGLQFLADMKRTVPGLVDILEGFLPPVLLFVLNLLVPIIFRLVLSFSRFFSKAELDSTVRNYLFAFYWVTTFLANVLVGSVLGAIDTIVNNPSANKIVSLLSTTVPAQGTFFCQFVLLNTFIGAGVGILAPGRLLLRPVFHSSARTERQIRKANSALSNLPAFKLLGIGLLISLICTVYSSIAPIICIIGTAYFGTAYMCTKHSLMYSDVQQYGGGGYLFRDEWSGVLFGVFMHQIIMTGLFSLKRKYPLVVLEVITLVGTVAFTKYCRERFWSILKHGSLIDQVEADEKRAMVDIIPGHYIDMYRHPALKSVSYFPEDSAELGCLEDGQSRKSSLP